MNDRLKGFVIGSDETSSGKVWKVRVKDPDSPYDGQKFTVASTHQDITLAQGLNITFLLGERDTGQDRVILVAVDVLLTTTQVSRS